MKMSQSPNNKGTATFIELKFYFRFNLVIKAHKSRSCQMNGTECMCERALFSGKRVKT